MTQPLRHYSPLDRLIMNLDQGVRTVFGSPQALTRSNPTQGMPDTPLTGKEKRHVAGLMRVDHAGEVSAQGLYQGQALTARSAEVREQMAQSALEENDHLAWCEKRLKELDDHKSYLNPIWYMGSFALGAMAGLVGDKWSLGFVVETERQVVKHLDDHIKELPQTDEKSRVVLEQMRIDEEHHAQVAWHAGSAELPTPVKVTMGIVSKVMTHSAYYF